MMPQSFIADIDNAISSGSREQRVDMLRKVTDLFINQSDAYSSDHVAVFGDVLARLSAAMQDQVRAELSQRLAPVVNAPHNVIKSLAMDDNIEVAAPVLADSEQLNEEDLVDIARNKSQRHLLAMTQRTSLNETVTDVIVERGDHEVVRSVAANIGAKFSPGGFDKLVEKSKSDDILASCVGLRADIPHDQFQKLIRTASASAREQLAMAMPHASEEIRHALGKVEFDLEQRATRDYAAALVRVGSMHQTGKLNETTIDTFAKAGKFEETAVALSLLCQISIPVIERSMLDKLPDRFLIIGKAAGLHWHATRSVLLLQTAWRAVSSEEIEAARRKFLQLQAATAQRIVTFFKARSALLSQTGGDALRQSEGAN
jgi:uncharacterized protein (DUF2336 family)